MAESPIPAEGRFPRVRVVALAERGGGWCGGVALDAAAGAGKRGSCCGHWHGGSSGDHSCTHRNGVCSTRTGSGDTDRRSHTRVHTVSLTAAKGEATRCLLTGGGHGAGRPHGLLLSLQEEKHVLTRAPNGGKRSRADAEGKCCESHSGEVPGRRQRGDRGWPAFRGCSFSLGRRERSGDDGGGGCPTKRRAKWHGMCTERRLRWYTRWILDVFYHSEKREDA